MHYHSVGLSGSHYSVVDLIALEYLAALCGFALLTHGSPYVCVNNIGVSGCFNRVADDLELSGVLFCEVNDGLVGEVALRAAEGNAHADLESAYCQGVRHVVAVADVAELQTVELVLMLADCLEVSENLAGVAVVGQTVDYRDRAVLSEILDFLLSEGADHNTTEVTGQNARGVLNRLAAADLKIAGRKEQRLTAELVHTGLKGNACSCGGLLEDHTEGLTLENVVRNTVLLLVLELVGKVQNVDDLFSAEIKQL